MTKSTIWVSCIKIRHYWTVSFMISCIGLGRVGSKFFHLYWVVSVSWWVGLDRVTQSGPMDNSVLARYALWLCVCLSVCLSVCLMCVCHKSAFSRNGWTLSTHFFDRECSVDLCYEEIPIPFKLRRYFPTVGLRNFVGNALDLDIRRRSIVNSVRPTTVTS